MTDRELMQQALEALSAMLTHMGMDEDDWNKPTFNQCRKAEAALRERLAQPVQCEPQQAVTEDGWCEWVCPKPQGYLMQCCDCGLIHEVESRVAKYEPRPSEVFEVVDDPDLQVQWRMKRRDDISPKQPAQQQEPFAYAYNGIKHNGEHHGPHLVWKPAYMDAMSAIMGAVAVPLYTSPPAQRKPLTDEAKAVIDAARAAMDDSVEAYDGFGGIKISSHLAASLSLCLDEYDRTIEAAPPTSKPWVGLTDEERHACTQSPFSADNYRAIEAKLREKNT